MSKNAMKEYDDNHRAFIERGAVIKRLQETIATQGEECANRHEQICELQAKYDALKDSHTNLVDACRAGGIELEFCLSNHEMDTPEMKVLLDTLAMIEQALEETEKIQ